MLNKEQINIIREGWATSLLTKYKDKFREFFVKLKGQLQYNATANAILSEYVHTGNISKENAARLKTISIDTMKMVGLGSLAFAPIPGGTLLMLFLINSAKRLNIDLLPSQFEAFNGSTEYEITKDVEDHDGDRTTLKVYRKPDGQPIGKLTFEKVQGGHDMTSVDEDTYFGFFPDDRFVRIEHVQVSDGFSQQGFGRLLMKAAIVEIQKTGFDRIYLNASPMGPMETRISLDDLVDFYESFGFKVFNHQGNNAEMYMEL